MNAENMYDAWDNGDRHEIRQQLAKRKLANDDDDTQVYRSELEAAVKAEREACAKVAEAWGSWVGDGQLVATAIRTRGEKK
jgi:hypothetical protein